MIPRELLVEARQLLRRLELVSQGTTMRLEPSRGGGERLFPPGGVNRLDDVGGDRREPDWMLRSHLHYRRRLAGVRGEESLRLVVRDMRASLRAWTHSRKPEKDTAAWRETLGRLAYESRHVRGARVLLAEEWSVSQQRLYQLERDYSRSLDERRAA